MKGIYIAPTSWGFSAFRYGKPIEGTERETKEEVEEIDFDEIFEKELSNMKG